MALVVAVRCGVAFERGRGHLLGLAMNCCAYLSHQDLVKSTKDADDSIKNEIKKLGLLRMDLITKEIARHTLSHLKRAHTDELKSWFVNNTIAKLNVRTNVSSLHLVCVNSLHLSLQLPIEMKVRIVGEKLETNEPLRMALIRVREALFGVTPA